MHQSEHFAVIIYSGYQFLSGDEVVELIGLYEAFLQFKETVPHFE